jgi:16S rRNA processing protein RimM
MAVLRKQIKQIVVGRLMAPYGIKGWVKVFSYTDPPDKVLDYAPWQIYKGSHSQSLNLEAGKRHGRSLIVLPEGFEDRTQAELVKGFEIRIDQEQLPALEQGDYYWHQLEGLEVINEVGERLGLVDHLLETGANDVIVVKPDAASIDDRERLVPYVEGEVVLQVDLGEGRILVKWASDF